MKPAPFAYHAPANLTEAIDLLQQGDGEAKVLAGGQSLIPLLNLRLARFASLVDLRRVDQLQTIERDGDAMTVGSMTRQSVVGDASSVAEAVPLLSRATRHIGHFQIRTRGTLGGALAHADPAAEYPAVALALEAELEVAGPEGMRSLSAADFFLGTMWTALDDSEVLLRVRFPIWGPHSGFAVEEVARRHGDFAIAGAVCAVQVAGRSIVRAAIALFGMGSTPVRARSTEAQLVGESPDELDPAAIGRSAVADLAPPDDLHASSGLRMQIGAAVVARALYRALEEATQR